MREFVTGEYLAGIEKLFQEKKNPAKAISMKAYMRNQFEFFGLTSPERKALSKSFLYDYGLPPDKEIPMLVGQLWELPQREFQYFGMELLRKRIKYMDKNFIRFLEELIIRKSWWDTIDYMAANLVSVHFQRFPGHIKPVLSRWMDSENIWLQRSCLLFQLKFKQKTDLKLLYALIKRLKESDEFFIQKAIGWILREYSKTNPEEVAAYVSTNELKPLSRREALKYINKAR